jgi:hypothetical protein
VGTVTCDPARRWTLGMTTPNPQLITCAVDVGYELKMIGILGQLKTPMEVPFVGYGLLESLLVHVRLLDDFLANRRFRDDDLTASDYNSSWPSNGFLRTEERSSIHKKVVHLTRSRQDRKAAQRWRTTGALDAEGNWDRSDLAERALAAFTKFIETLDPGIRELFEPDLTEAWKYYIWPFEVRGEVQRPQPRHVRAMVEDNRVTVWVGTGRYVVQDVDGDP